MHVPKSSCMMRCVVVDLFDLKKGQVQFQGDFVAVTVRVLEDCNLQCKRWLIFMAKGHPCLVFGDVVFVESNCDAAYVEKLGQLYNLHALDGMCPDLTRKLVMEIFNT
ncbi:hypothetical protein LCGC14_0873430 [marine sediment metagenome]|uniref:Uncharacterized protein n=1 Tax=marine sediment metagenome TaxID=412755 RepID=A0A0F9P406_9ZZZZ